MTQDTPKVIPRDNKSELARNLIRRIERLEDLAAMSGDLMLFIVSYENHQLLIADIDFGTVTNKYPLQESIDYIGRASKMYSHPQIIRSW